MKTDQKLILITSDDWGCKRLKSKETILQLRELGYSPEFNRFDNLDMLERNKDIEGLFEILLKHKDHQGHHPTLTAITNVANPDFKKIEEGGFTEYHYETIEKSYRNNPDSDQVLNLIKKGIAEKIYSPQLHNREHLQVNWWMKELQNKESFSSKVFELEFFFIPTAQLMNMRKNGLGAALDVWDRDDIASQKEIIKSGCSIFRDIFGYNSNYFVPPAMLYNKELEPVLFEQGIKMLDVQRIQKMPVGDGRDKLKIHYLGKKSKHGLFYAIRNVVFEPNLIPGSDGVDTCLTEIETAFNNRQPAIISNHRVSFVGGISESNRTHGLKALDKLLTKILVKWPDVRFIDTTDLLINIRKFYD